MVDDPNLSWIALVSENIKRTKKTLINRLVIHYTNIQYPHIKKYLGRHSKTKKPLSVGIRVLIISLAATYSPTFDCSTIGAIGLNFSVRNGKR